MIENLKLVYEDDEIIVMKTKRNYDFIAVIENKTTDDITIAPDESDVDLMFEKFTIFGCDWVGILADAEGINTLKAIEEGKFIQYFANEEDDI